MSPISIEQQRLERLLEITRDLSAIVSLEQLLHKIVQAAAEVTDAEMAGILLADEPSGSLRFMTSTHLAEQLVNIPVPLDSSIAGAAFASRAPVLVPDVERDPRYYRTVDEATGVKTHSLLAIPLQFQERCLGVLEVENKRDELIFNSQDTEILLVLAAQAAIAIQNAQLYQQARQRAEQLATINEIGWAVSVLQSQNRVVDIMDVIYHQVQHIVPADGIYICLYDHQRDELSFPLVYDLGLRYQEPIISLPPDSAIAQVLLTGQPVKMLHTPAEMQAVGEGLDDRMRAYASSLYMPLRSSASAVGVQVVGVLAVHSYAVNAYTAEHVEIVAGIETQVAIAIRNAQLYEQTQRQAEQLAMMNEIGRAVSNLEDIDRLRDVIYRQLRPIVPVDAFIVCLYEPDRNEVSYPLIYDLNVRYRDSESPRTLRDDTWIARVIHSGEPCLLLRTAEELQNLTSDPDGGRKSASLLYVPLWLGEQVVGVLSVQSYTLNAYTAEHAQFLVGIGRQIAIALKNAQLYEQAQLEIAERTRAEAEVRRHRDHLEELVEMRVAEIKQINAELQQQNAELDAFAHTVAHDLKNPLGPLMGFAHILLEELHNTSNEVAQECATHLLTASHKMARIIDELLLLASVRRQDEIQLAKLDMAAVVHEVRERVDYLAKEQDAEIRLPASWPQVVGHAAWIEEVWTNYLTNAIKYGGRPPCIELGSTTLENEGMVRFWVRDNGVGLAPEEQARLFTEFTQLHQLRAQGHGLGLSIVRRIVERLGGQVGVESAPDHGSVFYFTLPLFTTQSPSVIANA